jgi:ACS family glucarate transporter-like MFS transporter
MKSRRRYFIYAGMFIMLAVSYLDRINLSIAGNSISAEYGLSKVALGYVYSSYLWTYLIVLIPFGLAVDRIGSRRLGGASLLVWSIGGALTGAVTGLVPLFAARMVLGVGESAGYPVGGRVLEEWAPASERGRASSWLNGGAYGGMAIGALIVGPIVSAWGWQTSFYITCVLGVLFALSWWCFYRTPDQARWLTREERALIRGSDARGPAVTPASEGATREPILSSLKGLMRSPTMWGLALTQGCAGYTLYLFMTWLPSYLADDRGLSTVRSSIFTAVPYGVAVILGLLLGRFSDGLLRGSPSRLARRRRLIAACMLCSAVILAAPVVNQTWLLLVLFSISLTCVSTAMGLAIALTTELLEDRRRAGAAVSFLIFGGNLFGVLAPIVTGYVVAGTGTFSAAFLLAGLLLLIGCGAVLALTRRPIGRQITARRSASPIA